MIWHIFHGSNKKCTCIRYGTWNQIQTAGPEKSPPGAPENLFLFQTHSKSTNSTRGSPLDARLTLWPFIIERGSKIVYCGQNHCQQENMTKNELENIIQGHRSSRHCLTKQNIDPKDKRVFLRIKECLFPHFQHQLKIKVVDRSLGCNWWPWKGPVGVCSAKEST